MEHDLKTVQDLLAAVVIGLLIGIERGWKDRAGEEGTRVAGIRTFTLSAILGGISAQMAILAGEWILPAALLSFTIIITVAHVIGSRKREDVSGTTRLR